ncbi:hypothetical protein BTO04_05365 [Polaribacter sp. SA4-10]|uniref:hypothetical protein n=1 Tax=Polaribacter sp. SA4-10 TaxID=754397 RepID=UPI000B3BFA32|nr:hypothetical protein [Polaribacter sp. SA4-10]ARV06165.1 hypothetical protein BTO04_05365 [Polaribacter sp. SA4-10]
MNNPEIFKGTTVNERLYLSGKLDEFDNAIKKDNRNTAYRILRELKVDEPSIILIVGHTRESLQYPNAWDFPNENHNNLKNENNATLEYSNLNEIGKGAPISGNCKLNKGTKNIVIGNNCGGPALWNESGLKLAIPIWEKSFFKGTFQRIGILDLEKQTLTKYKKKYRVLNLISFKNNLIKGIDSPIHKTKHIEFDYEKEQIEKIIGIK